MAKFLVTSVTDRNF